MVLIPDITFMIEVNHFFTIYMCYIKEKEHANGGF